MHTETSSHPCVWARWGRRAVTVPLYLLLGSLTVALLPVTMALALAIDAVRRTGHLVTLRSTLGLTLYFACEAAGIAASFVLWVANTLWPWATADRVVTWNLFLQRLWARTLFAGAARLFSMRVEVTGEESVRRGPLSLFCRHASSLDTLLPAVFASQPYTLRIWRGKLIGRTIRPLLLAGVEYGDSADRGGPRRVARRAMGTDRCLDIRACQPDRGHHAGFRSRLAPRTRGSLRTE